MSRVRDDPSMTKPRKLWVLVIEDVADQAELLSDVCATAGLNVMTARTGLQGVRRARDLQPAIILLDLALPDIDGWEVCSRLKKDEHTNNIPIVILTAREERGGPDRAAAMGCVGHLKRPCPPRRTAHSREECVASERTVDQVRSRGGVRGRPSPMNPVLPGLSPKALPR